MHKSITLEKVLEAVQRRMQSLDNPGFCKSCGAEHYYCEPDARNYECESCGESEVFGADESLLELM